MKAIVIRRFGDASVLGCEDVADPEPGEGEVRIAVHAAGTNPVDAGNRADGSWAGIRLPWVPGYEVAGVVDRVGPGVRDVCLGERVVAITGFPDQGGGYAELAVVAAGHVAPLADSVSYVAAAATPLAGGTAWEVLERLRLKEGDRLLAVGASGGVGSYLLQLAALRGIVTVAVGRRRHHERLRALGAMYCIDYTDDSAANELRRSGQVPVSALADLVGGSAAGQWLDAVAEHGQIAAIEPPELDLGRIVDANITFHGVLISPAGERTRTLTGLLAADLLTAQVSHVLPLEQAAKAHQLIEAGHAGGKIVLSTDAEPPSRAIDPADRAVLMSEPAELPGDEPEGADGHVSFAGYRTWYRVVGDREAPGRLPLLCLHGGPGGLWHHMEPYAALAEGRRVIFYDQLGCGRSSVREPHDAAMWTADLYVREVAAVREALGLDRCHIIGHSWGGMLAMAYAVTQPAGVASIIVESSPASVPHWLTEIDRLRAQLPPDVESVLRHHEAAGTTGSEEYQNATMAFNDRHVCRVRRPWSRWLDRSFDAMLENPEVYHVMNGPSEFHVTGPLKDFDISPELPKITMPALLFCGEFDEVTEATMQPIHEAITGSQFVVMEGCSHMPQAERPEATLGLVRGWLAGVEASRARPT